jgi:hypothetical protein
MLLTRPSLHKRAIILLPRIRESHANDVLVRVLRVFHPREGRGKQLKTLEGNILRVHTLRIPAKQKKRIDYYFSIGIGLL